MYIEIEKVEINLSKADVVYNNLVKDIVDNGIWDKDQTVRTKWKDESAAYTKSIVGAQLKFDNSELAILTCKEVKWKTAIKEMLWIWQKKSNIVQDLRDMGVNIWNEWELPDGTIGKAYGYQLGKPTLKAKVSDVSRLIEDGFLSDNVTLIDGEYVLLDQVDYLLYQLKYNPASRRHITTLWSIEDLNEMSLTPCVWKTQWFVKENKLHLIVEARSNDIGIGHPFNVFQYNVLQRIFAQLLGYELGSYTFTIGDAHVYERHIEPLTQQTELQQFEAPQLIINTEGKNFYDLTIDDFELVGYEHGPFIRMEIAI
ncbi:Thymidylate synthase 1 [compost metagenome]